MTTSIIIELFSNKYCSRCSKAKQNLRNIVNEFSQEGVVYRELDVLKELDYAVSLGVLLTPAIAIDGELIFSAMPSLKQFEREIKQRLIKK